MKKLFQRRCLKVRTSSPPIITILLGVCSLVIFDSVANANAKECSLGQKGGLGWTEPTGDIVLQVGMPLEIFCMLNVQQSQRNDSMQDIVFYRNKELIDSRYVTKINETTSRLYIDNMTGQNESYYCKLRTKRPPNTRMPYQPSSLEVAVPFEETVCMNTVVVGSNPRHVENFACVSINWEALNCSWKVPQNFVPTNYTVWYMPPRGRPSHNKRYNCPTNDDVKNQWCVWTIESNPMYRRTYEFLIMFVVGTNQFGATEQSITFNHYEHIIPNPPTDLEMVSTTASSVFLKWKIGIFRAFAKPLLYKVHYMWMVDENWLGDVHQSKELKVANGSVFMNITNLPYPNTLYKFSVYMKPAEALNNTWWSQPVTSVFRTKACPPYMSPKMDVGSFQIVQILTSSRTVYVYWEPLPKLQYNGDKLHYEIIVFENGRQVNLNAIRINYSYAEFAIAVDKHYRFEVHSVNEEGPASRSTAVQVPAQEDVVKKCPTFTKTDYGNGVYELSWEPPSGVVNDITNYTIFWCESKREWPYQCNGNIGWEHFQPDKTKHNFTVNSLISYQFAISVNTAKSSSGMYWALCTVLHSKVGTVKHVHANDRGPFHVHVEWRLECSDTAMNIKGYRIYYCVILQTDKNVCQEPEQSVTVHGGIHKTTANVTNLRSHTYYKISVVILTHDNSTGPHSAEFITHTLEGPPDMTGLAVTVLNITNTSVEIEWDVPNVTNGMLQYYEVLYNQESTRVDGNVTSTTITGLQSYHMYNVTVKACTSICSEPMNAVQLRTRVGVPSVVGVPWTRTNGTHAFISWHLPIRPAGPHPIYEVWMLEDGVKTNLIETSETVTTVLLRDCYGENSQHSYEFKVRAKNVDTGVKIFGNWSPVYALQCVPLHELRIWKTGCLFGLLFTAVVLTYGGKEWLHKCKKMKSVQVTLPAEFTTVSSTYLVCSQDIELVDSKCQPQIKPKDQVLHGGREDNKPPPLPSRFVFQL